MEHLRFDRSASLRGLTFWIQWLVASTVLIGLLILLTLYRTGGIDSHYRYLTLLTLLGSVPAYSLMQVYHKHHSYFRGLIRLFYGWSILLMGLTSVGFISKTSQYFSREVFILWGVLGFACQALVYVPLHALRRRYRQNVEAQYKTLIVGTDDLALDLARKFSSRARASLVGLVSTRSDMAASAENFRVVGNIQQLPELISWYEIRRLYIAISLSEVSQIEALYIELLDTNVDVVWIPDLQSMSLLNHSISEMDGVPAIHLNESPLITYPMSALSKDLLDRSVALVALVTLSPLLIATAIAVKCSSPGPILFKQRRHGWNGKVIKIWKFRSMRLHDSTEVRQAIRDDPRTTRVGRFIRRSSIDELPQLFNVLQGRMSLVGPRPHAIEHNDFYTGKIIAYLARHRIKPGITGLAQIRGYRGETETLDKMQRRVEIDLEYINNWSLWLDVKILIKTPFKLFSKNIY